jgi:hypothetical protein
VKRFLVLLLVVVAVVVVAAFDVPSQAASVNGAGISQQNLDADLSAIAHSTGYQCYVGAGLELDAESTAGLFPVTGVGASTTDPATYNTTFVRYWLTEMLSDELVAQMVAARHLEVTPVDLAVGRLTLRQQITGVFGELENESGGSCGTTGTALLASLPASFRNEQIRAQSERDVLLAHEAGYGLSAAALARFFAVHRAEFDTECISYVSFSSESDATAAEASIVAGTPIAHTGTLTRLGCGIQHSITSLPTSVTSLAVGKVSTPLSEGTSTGKYALLEVTSRTATAFVTAKTAVEQAVLSAGSTKTESLLQVANRRATVTADPRYGRVGLDTVALSAPPSPSAAFVLNPSANLPTRQGTKSSPASQSGAG